MEKWKCEKCFGEPCILEIDVYDPPKGCPVNWHNNAKWEQITDKPEQKLPKLTAEVFDRPDCPEWAMYAAVDFSGNAYFYKYLPRHGAIKPHWVGGEPKQYIGNYAWMDWENSLVKRPEKNSLPEWCKVGDWMYIPEINKYFCIAKIESYFLFDKEGDHIPYNMCKQARLRPYNAEEMRGLVGKVAVSTRGDVSVFTDFDHSTDSVCICGEWFHGRGLMYSDWLIDGSTCSVLEHLENGEWVR